MTATKETKDHKDATKPHQSSSSEVLAPKQTEQSPDADLNQQEAEKAPQDAPSPLLKRLAEASGMATGLGLDLLGSIPVGESTNQALASLSELFNTLINQGPAIESSFLNVPKIDFSAQMSWAAKVLESAVNWFSPALHLLYETQRQVMALWAKIPPEIQTVINYVIGRIFSYVDSLLSSTQNCLSVLYEDWLLGDPGAFKNRLLENHQALLANLDGLAQEQIDLLRVKIVGALGTAGQALLQAAPQLSFVANSSMAASLASTTEVVVKKSLDATYACATWLGGQALKGTLSWFGYSASPVEGEAPQASALPEANKVSIQTNENTEAPNPVATDESQTLPTSPTQTESQIQLTQPVLNASHESAQVAPQSTEATPEQAPREFNLSLGAVTIFARNVALKKSDKLEITKKAPATQTDISAGTPTNATDTSANAAATPAHATGTSAAQTTDTTSSTATPTDTTTEATTTPVDTTTPGTSEAPDTNLNGGLEFEAGLRSNFFGKDSQHQANELGTKAVIDWSGKFRWEFFAKQLQLVNNLNLGIFHLESLILQNLQASNELVIVDVEAKNLGLGHGAPDDRLFNVAHLQAGWHSTHGFTAAITGQTLNLPEPFALKLSTDIDLHVGREGGLKHLKFSNFKAANAKGKELFTLEQASYAQGKGFQIDKATYVLPETYFGPNAEASLNKLHHDGTSIQEVSGHVAIEKAEPLGQGKGLSFGGQAHLAYQKGQSLKLSLHNGEADFNAADGAVKGSLRGLMGTYERPMTALPTSEGQAAEVSKGESKLHVGIAQLDLQFGPLGLMARGAELTHNETKKLLTVAQASLKISKKDGEALKTDSVNKADALQKLLDQLPDGDLVELSATKLSYDLSTHTLDWATLQLKLQVPRSAHFSLFGGAFRGGYDLDKGQADIAGQFSYPKGNARLLPAIGASYPIVPGFNAFADLSVKGGIATGFKASVQDTTAPEQKAKQEKEAGLPQKLDFKGSANLAASLGVELRAGFGVGLGDLASARAYISAGVTAQAGANADLHGVLERTSEKGTLPYRFNPGKPDGTILDFDFNAKLTAQVDLVADLVGLFVYEYELYRLNLKTWELGEFKLKGQLYEDPKTQALGHRLQIDGSYLDPKSGLPKSKSGTFGGLFGQQPELDPSVFQPVPIHEALPTLHRDGKAIKDPLLLRHLSIMLVEAQLPETEHHRLADMLHELGAGAHIPLAAARKKEEAAQAKAEKQAQKTEAQAGSKDGDSTKASALGESTDVTATTEATTGPSAANTNSPQPATVVAPHADITKHLADAQAAAAARKPLFPGIRRRVFQPAQWLQFSANKEEANGQEKTRHKIATVDALVAAYDQLYSAKLGQEKQLNLGLTLGKSDALQAVLELITHLHLLESACLDYARRGQSRIQKAYFLLQASRTERQELEALHTRASAKAQPELSKDKSEASPTDAGTTTESTPAPSDTKVMTSERETEATQAQSPLASAQVASENTASPEANGASDSYAQVNLLDQDIWKGRQERRGGGAKIARIDEAIAAYQAASALLPNADTQASGVSDASSQAAESKASDTLRQQEALLTGLLQVIYSCDSYLSAKEADLAASVKAQIAGGTAPHQTTGMEGVDPHKRVPLVEALKAQAEAARPSVLSQVMAQRKLAEIEAKAEAEAKAQEAAKAEAEAAEAAKAQAASKSKAVLPATGVAELNEGDISAYVTQMQQLSLKDETRPITFEGGPEQPHQTRLPKPGVWQKLGQDMGSKFGRSKAERVFGAIGKVLPAINHTPYDSFQSFEDTLTQVKDLSEPIEKETQQNVRRDVIKQLKKVVEEELSGTWKTYKEDATKAKDATEATSTATDADTESGKVA